MRGGWVQRNHKGPLKMEAEDERRGDDRSRVTVRGRLEDATPLAVETGEGAKAKETGQPLEAEKGKETDSFLEAPEGAAL